MGSLTFDTSIAAGLGFKKAIPVLAAWLFLFLNVVPLFSQGSTAVSREPLATKAAPLFQALP